MTIKIYKNDASPPARSTLIFAEILNLDYTAIDLNFMAGEYLTPEYLEKNPMHTVPVLEDGDFVLADSHAIVLYLLNKYGTAEQQEKWYPSDLKLRATITQRMFFESTYIFGCGRAISLDLVAGKKAPNTKQIENMNDAYGILEKYLEKTKFVAGDHSTIADLIVVVAVSSFNVYVPVDAKYTKIHAWWNSFKEEDWYKNINEPGIAQLEEFKKSLLKLAKYDHWHQYLANVDTDNVTIKIYKLDASPPARSAVIFAEILKLDYTAIDVNLLAGEHLTPEYLEKNPMHTVPVLEDGDFVLADSHAIIPYLLHKYGTAEQREKWYPNDLKLRATINQRMFFESANFFGSGRTISLDLIAGKKAPNATQIENMNDAYGILEKYLEKTKFVAGDHFTIADLTLVVAVSSFNVYVPVDAKYTKIHAWWNSFKEEDWYKNINEPGIAQLEEFKKSLLKLAK